MFEIIQKNLSGTERSYKNDLATFRKWEEGKISIFECYMRFKRNNNVSERFDCSITLFEKWLNSLGWVRK